MSEQDTSSLVSVFEDFFTNIYKERINDVLSSYPSTRSLEVDFEDIDKFDTTVADQLIHEPEVVVDAAEEAIRNLNLTLPPGVGEFSPHVRFYNGPGNEIMIERLSSKRLNELVTFKGIITKRTDVMHKVKMAHFYCQACSETYNVQVTRNFKPPRMCASCKKLALLPNEEKSKFVDIQKAEAQDLLEKVSGGSPAAKMELWFEDDIVNYITPGENVEVTGILRIKPSQNMKQKNELVFNRYVEVVHIKSLKRDFEEIHLTKEDVEHIKELSGHPEIINRIFGSIAPAVYGYSEVKKALALQLFGGTKGKMMKGSAAVRDDIHILLIGDPGIAKCADGDSEVLLADGSLAKIRDVVEEVLKEKGKTQVEDGFYATSNHDLVSLDLDARISPSKATYFWKLQSPKFMYEVETGTGKKVTVTPEHPFFISSDGHIASKPAKELKEGEFISTPGKLPIKGKLQPIPRPRRGKTNATKARLPKNLDADFARLLGYLAGDGYFRRTSSFEISLTNNDSGLLADFNSILKKYGIPTKVKQDRRTRAKTSFAFSVELGSALSSLGLEGKNARTKTIPQAILKSRNREVSEFIKAYFDCDATLGKRGITIASASRELLSRAQLLLLRFGIISQLHKTSSRATNTAAKKRRTYFRLFILGENAKKYAEHIGFNCKRKSKKLASISSKREEDFNTNIDIVPNLARILLKTRRELGLTQSQCGLPRSTYAHYEQGNRNPSRRSLQKIAGAFKRAAPKAKPVLLLDSLSKSHVFWDKVSRIRRTKPKEKWVYDLQVDPTHNFVANSLVVHNTRFLNSTSTLAPKSMYVSGKSVSGVGLTASAEKDELGDGGWTLKAGALVLASGGIGAIDEFDKIDDEDRASLHEVMESQTVSIAKAGIVAKFKAKTAIVAAANPKHGRFNQTKNLADQFDVPPSLLSRFDLIFPILDVLDEEKDQNLAEHILTSHIEAARGTYVEQEELLDKEILRKYIAYARRYVHPVLSDSAKDKIKEFYLDLRRRGKSSGSVPITPRYLEGLVRLAEAHAKIRLSDTVEFDDAKVAVELMDHVLRKVMTDQETGKFDVDIITTGRSRSQVEKVERLLDIIKEKTRDQEAVPRNEVLDEAESSGMDKGAAKRILQELMRKGEVYEKEPGWIALVGNR
ncbi:ATP-binding protein [Candidatus Micrarchaeota archaeon]|nr:ATP-binding protein [Candidatus Micrarchaeota archaeon]